MCSSAPASTALGTIIARYRPEIEDALREAFPEDDRAPGLYNILRYHLGWVDETFAPRRQPGGKLLRPTLCLLCGEAASGSHRRALPAAVAVELVHNFSLIHDDIEDHSPDRHGRRTVWNIWGSPIAINAGDAMFVLAQLALIRAPAYGVDPSTTLAALRVLNQCCLELTEGQHLDLSLEGDPTTTREQYLQMIARKTAALMGGAAQLGAFCATGDKALAEHYRAFGTLLGMAFQIQDDVLGIWGDPGQTGKPAAADVRGRKVTLPVIEGLQRAAPEVAADIRGVYRGPSPPSDDDVARIVAHLTDLGIREQVEAEAASYIEQALAALERASPQARPAAELGALARALVHRPS
ncbi:MAG TPA: polyprenyl synthetase family protein [Chloroflexota bacterium]|nr:polyprenyl synthetase family protein [Chloroflexota bacterium]